MRGRLALAGLLLSAGCQREPDFDERFNAQADRIGAAANQMRNEMDQQLDAAAQSGRMPVANAADRP